MAGGDHNAAVKGTKIIPGRGRKIDTFGSAQADIRDGNSAATQTLDEGLQKSRAR